MLVMEPLNSYSCMYILFNGRFSTYTLLSSERDITILIKFYLAELLPKGEKKVSSSPYSYFITSSYIRLDLLVSHSFIAPDQTRPDQDRHRHRHSRLLGPSPLRCRSSRPVYPADWGGRNQ